MATHESFTRAHAVKTSSNRAFGLVFAAVFAAVALWPLLRGDALRWWSAALAAALLIVASLRPALLAPFNRVWTRFGLLLHKLTSPLIMGLVFYGAVTPTAWIMRALGKDPLRRTIDRAAPSYWIVREPPTPDSIKHQF